ncbi:hypothetical protein N7462_007639 [Penicillium macrosclerotiorum]|uniref:uncharacterized protein n=1 Tax=Penicillium macrosclerotiorum TaxID=303699 RepID=UPI0025466635|nr:uncharacterized protein N7462_007639 [Penicillium macrosclerotiorum]KAJ5679395.1 hypothetical protein N7462_007639 [Penicillium macrosclerotiorum]
MHLMAHVNAEILFANTAIVHHDVIVIPSSDSSSQTAGQNPSIVSRWRRDRRRHDVRLQST